MFRGALEEYIYIATGLRHFHTMPLSELVTGGVHLYISIPLRLRHFRQSAVIVGLDRIGFAGMEDMYMTIVAGLRYFHALPL